MSRYIDADLIPYVVSEDGCEHDYALRYDINEIPTADVTPVVHAHWERQVDGTHYCSHCGHDALFNYEGEEMLLQFCGCGAKMDEETHE